MALKLDDLAKQGFRIVDGKLVRVSGPATDEGNDQGLDVRDLKSKLREQRIKARDYRSKLAETRARLERTSETLKAQDGIARTFDPVAKLFMVGTGLVFGSIIISIAILLAIILLAIAGPFAPFLIALGLIGYALRKAWTKPGRPPDGS